MAPRRTAGSTGSTRAYRRPSGARTWCAFPNKITLFRIPLETDFADPAELADEVRRTVIHELAHHAGISDERLHELGYD